MTAILRDSTVVVVVLRTRPRAILVAMITTRKSTHGFPFCFPYEYGSSFGGPSGHRSSAKKDRLKDKPAARNPRGHFFAQFSACILSGL